MQRMFIIAPLKRWGDYGFAHVCLSVCLCVFVCICYQYISRLNDPIFIKIAGYYFCVSGTNWINFGEAAIKCLRLKDKTQKRPYLQNQLRNIYLKLWNAVSLAISTTHTTRRRIQFYYFFFRLWSYASDS